jgi:hypothetical protein
MCFFEPGLAAHMIETPCMIIIVTLSSAIRAPPAICTLRV